MYVQLLELWPMAKLVVKQSANAHGPLVLYSVVVIYSTVQCVTELLEHMPNILLAEIGRK